MYRNYLYLNKEKIRQNVVFKLMILGYDIEENVGIETIRAIVRKIQNENGLIADGFIGKNTMPFLGYSNEEITRMLKIPKEHNRETFVDIISRLFLS